MCKNLCVSMSLCEKKKYLYIKSIKMAAAEIFSQLGTDGIVV